MIRILSILALAAGLVAASCNIGNDRGAALENAEKVIAAPDPCKIVTDRDAGDALGGPVVKAPASTREANGREMRLCTWRPVGALDPALAIEVGVVSYGSASDAEAAFLLSGDKALVAGGERVDGLGDHAELSSDPRALYVRVANLLFYLSTGSEQDPGSVQRLEMLAKQIERVLARGP